MRTSLFDTLENALTPKMTVLVESLVFLAIINALSRESNHDLTIKLMPLGLSL